VSSSRIGTEVAGYRLERILGRGGMSVVYLAEQVRLGRRVALKLLAPALSEDQSYRDRFMRESRRAAELDHPNIVPIYDAGDDDGQLYIAMRYVEGGDLKELIARQGAISLGRALFIVEQVASALDAAHERDLVHRDVKPSNILVSEPSDRVYLTDFGVVKHTASRGFTKTGFFIGTVDYAAPEQIEGLELDPRTDVYALGCVFYECLTAHAPFDHESEIAVMHAHLSEPAPSLTAARPDLPKSLNRVIATAMAKNREDRYRSCEAFVSDARNAALHRQPTTDTPRVSEEAPELVDAAVPPVTAAASAPGARELAASAPAPASPPAPVAEPEPVAAPPPPPAEPPAATPEPAAPAPDPGRSRISPWLVAALLGLAALAASALAVFFATSSDSSTTTVTASGTTAPEPTAQGLAQIIPPPLFKNSCHVQPAPLLTGAVQSVVCRPAPESASGRLPFYPDTWEASIFPDEKTLDKAYDSLRGRNDIGQDYGSCNGVSWTGESAWSHNPVGGGAPKPGGRRFCYFDGNVAVIVWTHDKLGQTSHIDMLAVAREGGSDHPALYDWWRFWHHRIGKCPEEGCTAILP
jgi:serine/threonine-protein kinase